MWALWFQTSGMFSFSTLIQLYGREHSHGCLQLNSICLSFRNTCSHFRFCGFFSCLTVCSVVWLYLYVYDVYLFGSFFYWNINWLLCVLLGILQMWIVRGNGRQLALFSSQQQFIIYHAKLFTIIMAYLPSDLNGDRKKRLEFKDIKSVVI